MGLLPHLLEMIECGNGSLEPSLIWQHFFAFPCKDRGFIPTPVTYAEFTENTNNTVGTKAFSSFVRNKAENVPEY